MSSLYVDIRVRAAGGGDLPVDAAPRSGYDGHDPASGDRAVGRRPGPEGQALSDTDIDSDTLTVPINTVGGSRT